jgi:ABC-type phosphate transport system substrate-binding protein
MRMLHIPRPSRRGWRALMVMAVALVSGTAARPAAAQGFQVIVNSANPVASLPKDVVAKLFLKQETSFPGGATATPVEPAKGSAARDAFAKTVLGWTVKKLDTYWQQQIFSGKDIPPASKATDDEVVAFVKANPGAIGFVSAGAATGGVKVITVQ